MKQWLFNFAAVFSLLLCLATTVLWVRSYWTFDEWRWLNVRDSVSRESVAAPEALEVEWYTQAVQVQSNHGRLTLNWERVIWAKAYPHYKPPSTRWRWHLLWKREAASNRLEFGFLDQSDQPVAGFAFWNRQSAMLWNDFQSQFIPTQESGFSFPHWLIIAIVSPAMLTVMVQRIRRMRRQTMNRCPACGYDLTGNTSGICPECGEAVVANVEVKA